MISNTSNCHASLIQAAWTSFHNNKTYVRSFLSQFHIGRLVPEEKEVRCPSLVPNLGIGDEAKCQVHRFKLAVQSVHAAT